MKQITHSIHYQEYDSVEELAPRDRELFDRAREAVGGSYAPYSHYHVGAAVRMANGKVATGSNQENMSFPAGLCAERVAVFSAASSNPGVAVTDIAITAKAEAFEVNEPVPPCGMCRQAIVEYEMKFNQPIRLILGGDQGKIFIFEGMRSLLPLAFHEDGLTRKK
ncbi:MAG TPA: cytidine deaminase [Bacteroidales bacterium]|nr:cytidine deaminase [Bacteroidales bacterium]HPS62341.1 cytidine deaminase [Bacteroidales bacterium]